MISKTPNSLTTRPLFDEFFPSSVITLVSTTDHDFGLVSLDEPFSDQQKEELQRGPNLDAHAICNVRQVHGAQVIAFDDPKHPIPDGDALITKKMGIGLAVRTADCLPIFFFDKRQKVIGLAHAGWRGTAERIGPKTIESMVQNFDSRPQDMIVAFGPCIRLHQYEVGPEFRDIFPDEIITISGRDHFDLALANRKQLREAGVVPESIMDCGICTYADTHYHSYRRDGQKSGRILSIIMLRET